MSRETTILVIDDDADLRQALVEQFELEEGFGAVGAASAAEGFAAAAENKPAAVVLDVSLSDMDGFAAWQEFAAGTTPTDAASFFQALDIAPAESPGVGIVVSWSGRADRVYDVLRSTNALYAPGPLAAGLAGAHSWTDQTPRDLATYRVQVQGP